MASIDWNGLLRLPGEPDRNFEHFTYELVRRHYGPFGRLNYPSNAAGVEFTLELAADCHLGKAGQIVAWQCKWYFANPRLDGSRKRDIKDSYSKARARLPKPDIWYLCTPLPLTEGEDRWLKGIETDVPICQWHEPDYEGLTAPPYDVVAAAWTGRLVLAPEWLATHVRRSTDKLQGKFVPGLHVPTDVEGALRMAVGDQAARAGAESDRQGLESVRTRLSEARSFYASGKLAKGVDAPSGLTDQILGILDDFAQAVDRLLQATHDMSRLLAVGRVSLAAELSDEVEAIPKDVGKTFLPAIAQGVSTYDQEKQVRNQAEAVVEAFDEAWTIRDHLLQQAKALAVPIVGVHGDAGRGKSNLAAFAAAGFSEGVPCAVFLHGMEFGSKFSLEDLPQRAGMPNASLQELLEALEAAGLASGKRALLVIDALNESDSPAEWSDRLAELITVLHGYPDVLAVVTFKTTYRAAVLPQRPIPTIRTRGFGSELQTAIKHYFDYYKISVRGRRGPTEYFRDPLLLRIFCEARNPDRQAVVEVDLERLSRFDLFAEYLEERERRIAIARGEDPRAHTILTPLRAIAGQMWDSAERSVSLARAKECCGDDPGAWHRSLLRDLLAETLLLDRDVHGTEGGEVVFFPYDAMAGYLIAVELLQRKGGRPGRVVQDKRIVRSLVSEGQDRHPLAEDVLAALAALAARTGRHLFDLSHQAVLSRAGLEAIATLPPSNPLPDSAATALRRWWLESEGEQHRRAVLEFTWDFALVQGHPLNFATIETLIQSLPMAERDLTWGEVIRRRGAEANEQVARIEHEFREEPDVTHADCTPRWLVWLLTTVDHELRDRVTRCLYWYGRKSPVDLFGLVPYSLGLNDPYVPERCLAAAYGVVMAAGVNRTPLLDAAIGNFASDLARRMFPSWGPAADRKWRMRAIALVDRLPWRRSAYRTTHRLTRDYARWILYLAHHRAADAPEPPVPPFLGQAEPWGLLDEASEHYDEVAGSMQMDFRNYTVGRLVNERSNYDMNHPEYKNVLDGIRWRIWDLGYRNSLFGEVDRSIASSRWDRSEREARVDRYGKKYSWIAFHEMEGRLEDVGKCPAREWDEGHGPDADIDPSFPEPSAAIDLGLGSWLEPEVKDDLEWLRQAKLTIPDSVLLRPEIDGTGGPWILAWGQIWEDGENPGRRVYALMPGRVVPQESVDRVVAELLTKDFPGRWILGEPAANHYIYAGEIPWSPLYDPWESVDDGHQPPGQMLAAEYAWESYHSIVNQAGGGLAPRRTLGLDFDLRLRPQTFDFEDRVGRLASVCRQPAPPWEGHLLYLRADLVSRRLNELDSEFVWIAWGERELTGEASRIRDKRVTSIYQAGTNLHRKVRMLDRKNLCVVPPVTASNPAGRLTSD
jgi:hypothetical protein